MSASLSNSRIEIIFQEWEKLTKECIDLDKDRVEKMFSKLQRNTHKSIPSAPPVYVEFTSRDLRLKYYFVGKSIEAIRNAQEPGGKYHQFCTFNSNPRVLSQDEVDRLDLLNNCSHRSAENAVAEVLSGESSCVSLGCISGE